MKRKMVAGKHGYYGLYDPANCGLLFHTFSLGIFRYEAIPGGVRKGNVFYRVKGYSKDACRVRERALWLCKAFDERVEFDPAWCGPRQKSEWVRG